MPLDERVIGDPADPGVAIQGRLTRLDRERARRPERIRLGMRAPRAEVRVHPARSERQAPEPPSEHVSRGGERGAVRLLPRHRREGPVPSHVGCEEEHLLAEGAGDLLQSRYERVEARAIRERDVVSVHEEEIVVPVGIAQQPQERVDPAREAEPAARARRARRVPDRLRAQGEPVGPAPPAREGGGQAAGAVQPPGIQLALHADDLASGERREQEEARERLHRGPEQGVGRLEGDRRPVHARHHAPSGRRLLHPGLAHDPGAAQ